MTPLRWLAETAPTSRADWRRIGRAVGRAVAQPLGAVTALVVGVAYLSAFALPGNVSTLRLVLTSSLPVRRKLNVLVGVYPPFSPLYSAVDAAFVFGLTLLVAANAAVVLHLVRVRRETGSGSATGLGVVGGLLGSGCAACGSAVVPVAGVSATVAALPLGGVELSALSLLALLLVLSSLAGRCEFAER